MSLRQVTGTFALLAYTSLRLEVNRLEPRGWRLERLIVFPKKHFMKKRPATYLDFEPKFKLNRIFSS